MPRRTLILALVAVLVGLVVYRVRSGRLAADPPGVVRQIQALNELSTVKVSVQKVVGIKERKQPLGEESLLIIVQGHVIGGIELAAIRPEDVKVLRDGEALIRLPRPKILHVYLDEKKTQIWDRKVTWWTPWVPFNPELETRARREAVESIRQTAEEMGILGEAQRNAESAIRGLLTATGFRSVEFAGGS